MSVPNEMLACVYRGRGDLRVEKVPVPDVGPGEVLVKVGACGLCSTDVKHVRLGLLEGPRIFGHETAGTIVEVGDGVDAWAAGDRVAIMPHVPDRTSWYSQRGLHSQCEQYKRFGVTAGFEPAGGGYAEYVKVFPWIVDGDGLVEVPADVSFVEATFVEPVNTCLKGIRKLGLEEEHVVLVAGVGNVGLLLMQIAIREGASVIAADPLEGRLALAEELGALRTVNPAKEDLLEICRSVTAGRGADRAIVAAVGAGPVRDALRATRPGATILLFAQTHRGDEVHVDVGEICLDEKHVVGSYSASVEETDEAEAIVFKEEIELGRLVTDVVPLSEAPRAFELASAPADASLKVVIVPDDEMPA